MKTFLFIGTYNPFGTIYAPVRIDCPYTFKRSMYQAASSPVGFIQTESFHLFNTKPENINQYLKAKVFSGLFLNIPLRIHPPHAE